MDVGAWALPAHVCVCVCVQKYLCIMCKSVIPI